MGVDVFCVLGGRVQGPPEVMEHSRMGTARLLCAEQCAAGDFRGLQDILRIPSWTLGLQLVWPVDRSAYRGRTPPACMPLPPATHSPHSEPGSPVAASAAHHTLRSAEPSLTFLRPAWEAASVPLFLQEESSTPLGLCTQGLAGPWR